MTRKVSPEYTRRDIMRLCHTALDSRTLRVELLKRLQTIIPFDYVYFSTTDPSTNFITSSVLTAEPPSWLMSLFLENEFLQNDFNKFNDMFRTHQPVSVLSEATRHELHRSQRYRDMLLPMAMEDELRAIFISDAACWGTLCLHRASGYTPAESACLAALAPHIADGLRKALLLDYVASGNAPDGPGVLILNDDLATVAMTAAGEYWLMELTEMEGGDRQALPLPVRSVVAALKAMEGGLLMKATPKVRLPMRSGHWLVLYASRLKSLGSETQISVIFEQARPAELVGLMMQVYQLTKREGEITQCVLRGWSTTEIAAHLHISANTVQDHLKAIFGKVDVSSRGELMARIFTQQYQPKFLAGDPLDVSGYFAHRDQS